MTSTGNTHLDTWGEDSGILPLLIVPLTCSPIETLYKNATINFGG